ncbi:MAG: hypothetical protein JJU22_10970 [Gammaproteobacteria bacterium]|nr:hypothetical protein [Gammaproteobacteria bacterium]
MSKKTTPTNHGEGDPESDRRYREDAQAFVDDGKVKEAAEKARNMSEEEKRESLEAEEIGKRQARGKDPKAGQKTREP